MSSEVEKQVVIARAETEKLVTQTNKLVIRKDADLEQAAEFLAQVKRASKNVKLKKDTVMKPLNTALKAARELFKPLEDQLNEAEGLIKTAMLKYQSQVEARAARQADKIEAAVESGELDLVDAMAGVGNIKQAPTSVITDNGTVSFKEGPRKVRITDPSIIPTKYFLNERVIEALRLAVTEDVIKKGLPCPPGAEVYREKQVAGRTND